VTRLRSVPRRGFGALEPTLRLAVHSNLFISLSATGWVVTTALLVGLELEAVALFIVFAATFFVYSLNRVTDIDEDEHNVPGRAAFTRRYGRTLLVVGAAGYALAAALAIALGLPLVGFLALPLVVAVLYSTARLKRLLLVKNLVVGLAWGVIPLGVGVYYGVLRQPEIPALAVYVTAVVTVAAIVFDVKDIEGDRLEGIRTVPNRYGTAVTRRVTAAANLAIAAGLVGAVGAGVLPSAFLWLLALNLYLACYIPFADPDRGPLYYGFVVDGEHLALAAVVYAASVAGLV